MSEITKEILLVTLRQMKIFVDAMGKLNPDLHKKTWTEKHEQAYNQLLKHIEDSEKKAVKDLGWMNGWSDFPEEYLKCRQLKHPIKDVSHYPSGSHHEVTCDICRIKYHYDSSG